MQRVSARVRKRNDKRTFLGYNENMKTFPAMLALGVGLGFFVAGCTPSEEEMHPRRRSVRADNLRRYLAKAHRFQALAQARSTPLVQGPLLPRNTLRDFLPRETDTRVSAQIAAQQQQLQALVRQAAARRAADETAALLSQYRQDAVQSALQAQTPQELATQLTEKNALYTQKISDFSHQKLQENWLLPNEKQSRFSQRRLKRAFLSLAEAVGREYGAECALHTEPFLQKTADDYLQVLSSAQNAQQLQDGLTRLGDEADRTFSALKAQYEDPLLALSPQQAASLRVRLIEAQQETENLFQKLYGKSAVLQTRDIFEKYKNQADAIVRVPARFSRMQAQLNRAGELYRQEMTQLQVRLNRNLERRAAQMRRLPLTAARN